ncbi:hypothetical protein [Longitalea luteola]|uniref:hypothetical protein n=1 Tax=Longitalea luteola TaxID=2812563 RepID=UPI001A957067|nr:hypothetical protein [Longitalea luteola]
MAKPTIYTAFCNSMENSIPNLSEEAMKISDLIQDLVFSDKLYYIKDEIFDLQRLMLNFDKHGRRIDIFYYSGHGEDGCLQLTGNHKLECWQMADLVNTNLKNAGLVFFNACETFTLAQEIIKRRNTPAAPLVLISCKKQINSFIAEHFATLLFKQIGQPGTYRDAYNNAKALTLTANKHVCFKEFHTIEAVKEAGDDFDFGYIEIAASDHGSSHEQKARSSIIGQDKLVRDALTSNYVHEVVESITTYASEIGHDKLQLLKSALLKAEQIARGEKKNKEATQLFNQAAEAVPGLSSGKVFESLINAEKNMENTVVKNLLKTKDAPITIGDMLQHVNSITA